MIKTLFFFSKNIYKKYVHTVKRDIKKKNIQCKRKHYYLKDGIFTSDMHLKALIKKKGWNIISYLQGDQHPKLLRKSTVC